MIEKKILSIVESAFKSAKNVNLKTTPNDIDEWDSLGHVMLIQSIEEEFEIQFELDELMSIDSLQSILDMVVKKTK